MLPWSQRIFGSFSSRERQQAAKRGKQVVTPSRVALSFAKKNFKKKPLGPEYICASSGKSLATELAEQEENRKTEGENEADE